MASPDLTQLTAERSDTIFKEIILPAFIKTELGKPISQSPEAIVLGGQPGSGKTGLLEESAVALKTKGATWVINGDDFYAFHPGYSKLQQKHGAEAANMVKAEASIWVKKTIEAAKDRGVNIVLESTMRRSELVKTTLENLKKSGYKIHAKVLAVKEHISWQGNHMRHEALSLTGAYSRLTSREIHDSAVLGVVKTLAMIEQKRLADRITVHQQNGKIIFDSREHQQEKQRSRTPGADALVKARERPWTSVEIIQHTKNWQTVEALAAKRHERENVTSKRVGAEMAAIRTQRNLDAINLTASRAPAALERTSRSQDKER